MPLVIVNEYCSKCQCDSCRAIRHPETPEEIGRRWAEEVFAKVIAQLDQTDDAPETQSGKHDGVQDRQPVTTEHYGQVIAEAIAAEPNMITLTEGQINHIASEERKARQRRIER